MDGEDGSGLRTLLVGIDAGTLSVLDRFSGANLPTIDRILTEGVYGSLESQIPPWTASAWPSMYTGKNPGKHGIFGFLTFEGYDWDVVNATHVREPAIWELLDYHGLSSVVVNVPVTYPPRSFDGALIPGYTAPENPECHPEGLLEDVRDAIGGYALYAPQGDLSDDEQLEYYRRLTRMRGEAFRYLADRFDPAFGFVQFQQTDTVFHERPGDWDAVESVYSAVDDQLGKIIDACGPDTVLLASDHGMGSYDGYEFRINEHLREQGYLTTKRGGSGNPTWVTIREDQLKTGSESSDRDEPELTERTVSALSRAGLTTQRAKALLDRIGLTPIVGRHVPLTVKRAGSEQVDFASSEAFVRDRIELGVRINLEGREPAGTVPESEYEAYRDRIIETLSDIETPEGEPLFADVSRREQYFQGPAASEAVDVVTVPAQFQHLLSTQVGGSQFGEPDPWHHKLDGLVAAWGDGVRTDADLGDPHLFDIAPTVLATVDRPTDEAMDGQPLPVVDTVGETAYPEFDHGEMIETDDPAVEDRLADLGYIERQ